MHYSPETLEKIRDNKIYIMAENGIQTLCYNTKNGYGKINSGGAAYVYFVMGINLSYLGVHCLKMQICRFLLLRIAAGCSLCFMHHIKPERIQPVSQGTSRVQGSKAIHKQRPETQRTVLSADKSIRLILTSEQQLHIRPVYAETSYFLDSVGVLALANVLHIFYQDIVEEARQHNGPKDAGRKEPW
jgi:hypothetical protein